ncbi:HAUS augmin-like complex subunit 6 N-terminus-domain-containing protein [Paraphysoderma sedebokerense]|nr:HAUS augmin-like complex subunit 6 N-terminus-domain-containing protein [Paraphysoderma sedebokerense]
MQDSTLSPQQLFLTNLRILSFPENQYTKYVHLPLSHNLFSRSSGNGKSFEFIAHFLFAKLDQDRALKSFRSCYPVADKTMAREFRNVVFKWCEELKGELKGECWVRRSFFDECRGERFERLLLAISNHVVQVVAGREYRHKIRPGTVLDVDSTRRLMSLDELKETLMNQIHIQSTQFLAEAQQQSLKQRLWNDTAQKYLCQNDEFNTTIATLKQEFLNLTKEHSYLKEIENGAEAVDRMNDMLEKAKYLWKCLVELMTRGGRDFEMIDKIIGDEDFNHVIDGAKIKSQLPKQSTIFDQKKILRSNDIQLSSLLKSGVEAVRCLQSSLNDSALTSNDNPRLVPSAGYLFTCYL